MNVSLKRVGGAMKVEIDGKYYEPLSFKSFRPTSKNISEFYDAGVRLFSILTSGLYSILGVPYSLYGESWIGENKYDFDAIDRQIELFLDNAPDGYFALMFQLDTRAWFIEKEGVPNSFTNLSQIAGNDKWRKVAAEYMKAVICHTEEKYGGRFYGYFLLGGTTTEWFSGRDYFEAHPLKDSDYKRITGSDKSIPTRDEVCLPREKVFLDPKEDKVLIDYVTYHNTIIADAICYFAAEAQTVLKHKKLLGVYYGYLFELRGARVWNDGSLGFMRVFDSPNIDMISSPSSYAFRSHIDPSAFMVTYDSLDRRNKLYYLEFDHITHLAPQYIEGFAIPGFDSKLQSEQETIDVMRRDFVLTTSKGAALWWFDMFEGWFYSEGMMGEVKKMIDISTNLSKRESRNVSEIAVFAEGNSLMYVNKECEINQPLIDEQRKGLSYLGAPYDVFDISDLTKIDTTKYKLFIFLDNFKLSKEHKMFIETRLKTSCKTILWCYGAGYIKDQNASVDNISDLVDIKVEKYTGTHTKSNAYGETYGFETRYDTMFYSNDGEVLGSYEDGNGALVRKTLNGYTSVYSALGNLPGKVLKEIARDAGVFIYSDTDDLVYANSTTVSVCSDHDGEVVINVPNKSCTMTEQFSGDKIKVIDGKLIINMRRGEVKMFVFDEK